MRSKVEAKKLQFDRAIRTRLERAQIECNDAIKVIESRDSPETFHYIDPPYVGTNMGHYSGYSEADLERLLDLLAGISGKFLLSNYRSDVLDRVVSRREWHLRAFDKQLAASGRARNRKVEVLIANFQI